MLKLDACYWCPTCSDGLKFGTGDWQNKTYSRLFLFPDFYWYVNSIRPSRDGYLDINLLRKAD